MGLRAAFSRSFALASYQLLYNGVFLSGGALVPWVIKGQQRIKEGLSDYLGSYKKARKPFIWVHGVSLGESFVACAFIEKLRLADKSLYFGFTSTHPDVLATIRRKQIAQFSAYFPLDFLPFLHRAFSRWNPDLVIVSETDFWPMFSFYCRQKKIPLVLINGRISEKLERFYSAFPTLGEIVFESFQLLCVQANIDRDRLISMGANPEKIKVLGNIKADLAPPNAQISLEAIQSWSAQNHLIVFGSLHPSEFFMLKPVLCKLVQSPEIKLIIAPRNINDAPLWAAELEKMRVKTCLRSRLAGFPETTRVILLDTFGELASLYGLATAAFIGGSLDAKTGGHNPIEALYHKVPVIIGPHTRNYADVCEELVQAGGAIVARDASQVESAFKTLLLDSSLARAQVCSANNVLTAHQGALLRTIEAVQPFMINTPRQIA